MKKIMKQGILFLYIGSLLIVGNYVFSAEASVSTDSAISSDSIPSGTFDVNGTSTMAADAANSTTTTSSSTSSDSMKIIVTERVPGGDCTCMIDGKATNESECLSNISKRTYECTVPQGLAGFQEVFAKTIRYFIYIVLLLGVLGIVGLGIAWAFAGGDDVKMKTTLKHWGVNIVIGLVLLFLFSYILMTLAPWVFTS